jgi:hypothetical protein
MSGFVDVTVPRVLADLLVGPEPPRLPSVDEALVWLRDQPWPVRETASDASRRLIVKRLLNLMFLVDSGRISEWFDTDVEAAAA